MTEAVPSQTELSQQRTHLSEHRTDLSEHRTDLSEHRSQLADERTGLAIDRTRLAHERTLMAWVRTATSLISFGFTIYKFFQGLREGQQITESRHLLGARGFALIMIGLGVGSLLLATIQHRAELRKLATDYPQYGPMPRSTSMIVGSVVAVFGIGALIIVILHQ